jgi:hypothetical protein
VAIEDLAMAFGLVVTAMLTIPITLMFVSGWWPLSIVGFDLFPAAVSVAIVLVAVVGIRWTLRRLLFDRWRCGELSHRQMALALTLLGPTGLLLVVVVLFTPDTGARLGLLAIGVVSFAFAYPFSLLMLRWFGGEFDPPASKGYRRRP